MQSLQDRASALNGVSQDDDAFEIDEINLDKKLGHETFVKLSTNFYSRVYAHDIQRMGGPPLYSRRKGHPALIGRHGLYPVTERERKDGSSI
ncbi:two-on-two hemoglobin-3-like [Selaginella moellendorffii]|uniref:two-on-two hemoglobin-3-like n=1 Tax=Selaginella moellendorffii TaxID=88036 RepID=UPI000D1C3364|nr:two-on-two hemoglobin-3-like [Selaginella moellendorffii]|eukprot:XP_024539697.1 two-on-two hemoglobin-3-like [Selaginella moellendorffii]